MRDAPQLARSGTARAAMLAPDGIPEVRPGDDLAGLILTALRAAGDGLDDGDVLVVTQKIVSKAEGRLVDLATVAVSAEAAALAERTGKDPRLVELILRESAQVLRAVPGVLIVEHRLGMIIANAGIDQSNLPPGPEAADGAKARALLLPENPDASAAALRAALQAACGRSVAVVIADSAGRAWRRGTVGIAIGVAGLPALQDLRGQPDRSGQPLAIKQVALADQIASAGLLLIGEANEGRPVALLRGLATGPGLAPTAGDQAADSGPEAGAAALLRPADEDLFR